MNYEIGLVLSILLIPITAALILVSTRQVIGRYVDGIVMVSAGLTLLAVLGLLPVLFRGIEPRIAFEWLPQAGIYLILHVDWLTFPFLLTEALVTVFAVIYSLGYHHRDERTPFFYALILIFGVGMAGTTLADSIFLFLRFLGIDVDCVLRFDPGMG